MYKRQQFSTLERRLSLQKLSLIHISIARVYQPGIQFDSVVVLNGPQGMGKSSFFAKLGGKWFSDSLTIGDMKDKTCLLYTSSSARASGAGSAGHGTPAASAVNTTCGWPSATSSSRIC